MICWGDKYVTGGGGLLCLKLTRCGEIVKNQSSRTEAKKTEDEEECVKSDGNMWRGANEPTVTSCERRVGFLCYCNLAKWWRLFLWWCIVSLAAGLDAPEVWGLWLMLKASAPVTWRKGNKSQMPTDIHKHMAECDRPCSVGVCVCVCVSVPRSLHKGFRCDFPVVIFTSKCLQYSRSKTRSPKSPTHFKTPAVYSTRNHGF